MELEYYKVGNVSDKQTRDTDKQDDVDHQSLGSVITTISETVDRQMRL